MSEVAMLPTYAEDQMVPVFDNGNLDLDYNSNLNLEDWLDNIDFGASKTNITDSKPSFHNNNNDFVPQVTTAAPMDTGLSMLFPASAYLQDDITFYDDVTPFIKKEKEDVSLASVLMTTTPTQDVKPIIGGSSSTLRDEEIEKAKGELNAVSDKLQIPLDAPSWSPEEVQRWAEWSLSEYCLNKSLADDFRGLDGTNLCMMTMEDFRLRSPNGGEALYTQLEFWRNAYHAVYPPIGSYDPPTYTELSVPSMTTAPTTTQMTMSHPVNSLNNQNACYFVSSSSPSTIDSSALSACVMTDAASNIASSIPRPTTFSMMSRMSPVPSIESLSESSSYTDSPASSFSSVDDFEMSPHTVPMREKGVTPTKTNIHLWQFLRDLLQEPRCYGNSIRWLDRPKGIFKIEDSSRVARLWGQRKNRPAMNYDKLSRSIRQYYKKGIIKKTDNSKRLVYQFCPNYRV